MITVNLADYNGTKKYRITENCTFNWEFHCFTNSPYYFTK